MNNRRRTGARRLCGQRKKQNPRPRILIICDGQTESFYFQGFKHYFKLQSVKIVPVTAKKPGVHGILARVRQSIESDDDWDEIHCVLDIDDHFAEVKRVQKEFTRLQRDNLMMGLVRSDPCFEYWLLLHFEHTDAPFSNVAGGKTAAQQVIKRLRSYIPHYTKTGPTIFNDCCENVGKAVKGAGNHKVPRGEGRPATEVGKFVARLLRLRQRN